MTMTTVALYGASDDLFEVETLEGDGPTEEYTALRKQSFVIEDKNGKSMVVTAYFGQFGWELSLQNNPEAGEDGENGYGDWAISYERRARSPMPDPAIRITAPGPVTLVPLKTWRKQEDEKKALEALVQARLEAEKNGTVSENAKPLEGLNVCLTGSTAGTVFENYTRAGMKTLIEDAGGALVSTITATTGVLVQSREGTEKAQRAKALGVTTLTFDEFNAQYHLLP